MDRLAYKGIKPHAVLGYCFGEFAAAIVAGILSENAVIDILVRRAAALDRIEGNMLNVFEEERTIRRLLLRMAAPPNIAIFAGLKHTVLSGSIEQISAAQKLFQAEGIRCKLVPSFIPFHSSVMDSVVETLRFPAVNPKQARCMYISGLLGIPINGENLGAAYWLRHMRDPLQFFTAMQYIRKEFPDKPLYDCGPGTDLTSIITRYGWENVSFYGGTKTNFSVDVNPIKKGL